MLGGKGHTPVSNWNAIMYELTWLQGWGAEEGGGGDWKVNTSLWCATAPLFHSRHSRGNGTWMSLPPSCRWRVTQSWVYVLPAPEIEDPASIKFRRITLLWSLLGIKVLASRDLSHHSVQVQWDRQGPVVRSYYSFCLCKCFFFLFRFFFFVSTVVLSIFDATSPLT